jgi:flagellar hook-length control protein FliK
METAITGRSAPQLTSAPLSGQAGSSSSAFADLFAGTAALTGKQPAMEKGTENAGPSAEQIMKVIEAEPEAINELIKQYPELEEAVMYIAELILDEQGGKTVVPGDTLEEIPTGKDNVFTKLAAALRSPNAEAAADIHAGPGEVKPELLGSTNEERTVKAELPVPEQLAARFNDLAPRDQQAIQMAAVNLQKTAGSLLSKALVGEEKEKAEALFTNQLSELTELLSKVLPESSEKARPEAALIAAAVAAEALVQGNGMKEKTGDVQPEQATSQKAMSRIEKLDILFPEKTPEVRQLISSLAQLGDAKSSPTPRPQLLPQMPAGWMSPAAGKEPSTDDAAQAVKHDLHQWQKYLSGREQPGTWVPKALQPSTGEQPEKQLTAFIQSLSALVKKQPSVSLTAETKKNKSFTVQLEQILRSIRGETGNAPASSAPAHGAGEPRALQLNAPLVIQLPPASEGNQRQAEFLKQFQQTLGTMNAAQLKNGASYTIRLHPEHLGRLDVKLTKIEGQWTAQLITTSKGAQELVESSVHQLRHSFLQQNLQVERIEVAEHPDFYKEEEQKEDPEEQREAVNMQEESSEEEERSFEDILQQLSVNERI